VAWEFSLFRQLAIQHNISEANWSVNEFNFWFSGVYFTIFFCHLSSFIFISTSEQK